MSPPKARRNGKMSRPTKAESSSLAQNGQSVPEPIFNRMDLEVLDKLPNGRWKNKATGKIWKAEELPPYKPPRITPISETRQSQD